VCIAVLFVSIILEFYGRACGFLLTSDSLQYLSASQSFSQNGKFLSPDGSYYSYWPPLFPIILSFFKQPQSALIWVNIVCKIILMIVLFKVANTFIKDSLFKIAFITASLLGVHVEMVSVFVWSELVFMMLIFLNWYFALQLKNHRGYFYGLLITGFLACLQRNAGLFWMCGVCSWFWLDTSLPLKIRIRQCAILFLVSTSGMWAWNIYNTFFIPADFNFYQHNFFADALPNLQVTLSALGKMILPINGIVAMVAGILFLVVLVINLGLKTKNDRGIQFSALALSFYFAGFLVMPRLDVFEMDRYLSVVTPLIYLFVYLLLEEKLQLSKLRTRIMVYILLLLWLSYPLTRTIKNVQSWHKRSCSISD
jgi:hypothetical protein